MLPRRCHAADAAGMHGRMDGQIRARPRHAHPIKKRPMTGPACGAQSLPVPHVHVPVFTCVYYKAAKNAASRS